MRLTVRAVRGLHPAPADICARLQAWQQAGYPIKDVPKIDDPAFDAVFTLPHSLNGKIDRAAKRLRSLGVSRRTSRRFTGDTDELYKGWDLDDDVPIGDASG
jgi:3-mercaptopyruvate sulfurtransferase SseA